VISDSYFSLDPIARYEYTKAFRDDYDERNFCRAYEYICDLDGDPLDHLVDIHSVLVKDTLHQDLYGFRDTPVQLVEVTEKKVLQKIPVFNFSEEIKRISKEKSGLEGLDQAAFEHVELLKIHPFHDGNGRLARFITCKRLADMEAKYFYRYLEKKSDEHIEAITQVFYKDKGFKAFADFLRRITVF
jgi:prophage maintenance system killer protein